MSKLETITIDTPSGSNTMQIGSTNTATINLGVSGDTINVPAGVTLPMQEQLLVLERLQALVKQKYTFTGKLVYTYAGIQSIFQNRVDNSSNLSD